MNSRIFQILVAVYNKFSDQKITAEKEIAISEVLKKSNLSDDSTPAWLVDAFQKLLNEEITERISFNFKSGNPNDWLSFIAKIPQILPVKEEVDNGENIFFIFKTGIGLYICFESDDYQIKSAI